MNWLANLLLKDYSGEIPLLVSSPSKALLGRDKTDAVTAYPRVENLILLYEDGSRVDIESVKSRYGYRWNSRARTILWVVKTEGKTASEILAYFWKHDLLNVALLVENEKLLKKKIFIYNPFVPVKSSSNTRGILRRLKPGDSMFPDKLNDLYNHTIRVSVFFHFPKSLLRNFTRPNAGADIEVLRTLSAKLNFNVNLITAPVFAPSYFVLLPSGERVGIIGDVLVNKSDIVLTAIYMESTIGRRVEFTYPTVQTGYCILVPKAKVMPMIRRMLSPFPRIIWTAAVIIWVSLLCCLTLMGENNKFLKVLELLFHHRLQAGDRNRTFDRVFCISCIWWAYLMGSTYQASFVKELMLPKYYKDLDTLEELEESELQLVIGKNMMGVLNNSEVPVFKNLAKRAVEHLVFNNCLKQLLTAFNLSCAVDEHISLLRSKTHVTNDNRPLIHKMKECLSLHWDVYVTKQGFPFLDKFNQHIQNLIQAGLYNKWLNDILTMEKVKFDKYTVKTATLTMKHFEGIFFILFVGLCASTVVFLLELLLSKTSFKLAS